MLKKVGFHSNLLIGDRYFELPPSNRYFSFYTEPKIKVFMPLDEPDNLLQGSYGKSQFMMHKGGYGLFDST